MTRLVCMKSVFFDLDGTLFNTLEDIAASMNYALRAWDIEPVALEDVRRYVGNGLRKALLAALKEHGKGRIPEEDTELAYSLMVSHYRNNPVVFTKPYEGIPGLVEALKSRGFVLGIVSNKDDGVVQEIVERFPMPFDFISGAVQGLPLKPDPSLLLKGLESTGSSPSECIYVGDSEVDQKTAFNAGCALQMVSYGFRTAEELKENGIENALGSVRELSDKLLSL